MNGINYLVTCADGDEAPQSKNEWKQQQQIVDVWIQDPLLQIAVVCPNPLLVRAGVQKVTL
jgi:hypothetical protein